MSLKAREGGWVAKGSFLEFWDKDIVIGAVGMWESRSDFQGRWEARETVVLVFRAFHGSSFPRPSCGGLSTLSLGIEAAKQLALGILHAACCLGIAVL
jgi:hypothetical protein